jgi:hypothetical protein
LRAFRSTTASRRRGRKEKEEEEEGQEGEKRYGSGDGSDYGYDCHYKGGAGVGDCWLEAALLTRAVGMVVVNTCPSTPKRTAEARTRTIAAAAVTAADATERATRRTTAAAAGGRRWMAWMTTTTTTATTASSRPTKTEPELAHSTVARA